MRCFSTRAAPDSASAVTFREALFRGLAPDGGLYHPVPPPDLKALFSSFSASTSFQELAEAVCRELFAEELGAEAVSRIVRRAFPFAPVLRPLEAGLRLLELFHGPTLAFKDFGACFQAAAMEELLREQGRRALILVATSGDTGSAVARAFFRRAGIDVVILYPSGRVSPLQEKQLTTLGENVTALEVLGSFDDCQRLAKQAFRDEELARRLPLTSANSINLGRLLPQALYYIYGFTHLAAAAGIPIGPARFCVPSGNFGNLTAGVYAWQWGLPVEGFIAATNVNDVVPEYLATGVYRPRASLATLSNAMDVGDPSNFERLQAVFASDLQAMRRLIHGERITDAETRDCLRRVYEEHGLLVDPHTAVGVLAARRFREKSGFTGELLVLATAHPGKFPQIVQETSGVTPHLPPALKALADLPKRSVPIAARFEELKELLLQRYAGS
jgi:threonine synthase